MMEEYFNTLLQETERRMAAAAGMEGKETVATCREMVSYLKAKNRELESVCARPSVQRGRGGNPLLQIQSLPLTGEAAVLLPGIIRERLSRLPAGSRNVPPQGRWNEPSG